jgi:L-ascorbate metabolism protein UlaG (beta-lactamase superfamily)
MLRLLMKTNLRFYLGVLVTSWGVMMGAALTAGEIPQFTEIQPLTNQEMRVRWSAPTGFAYRLDVSASLADWTPLLTVRTNKSALEHADSATPFLASRFYRALQLPDPNALTGDYLTTAEGEVVIHPIIHATLLLGWGGKAIYVDPVSSRSGQTLDYKSLPRADLILLTHEHSDHLDVGCITAIKATNAIIVAPSVVYQALSSSLRSLTTVMTNGAAAQVLGLSIEAVPAYNRTTSHHPKGAGNGYLLTLGGKRIYLSGDTQDTPEMRALRNIDVAFLSMNQPYTMTVAEAVSAVREFKPSVVYPYHSQGSPATDLNSFKQKVGTDLGIEVRLRKWY